MGGFLLPEKPQERRGQLASFAPEVGSAVGEFCSGSVFRVKLEQEWGGAEKGRESMHLGRMKPLTVFPKQPPCSLALFPCVSVSIDITLLFLLAHCYLPSLPLLNHLPFSSAFSFLPYSLQSLLLCLSFFSPFWLSLICHLNLFFLLCASFCHFLGSWEHLRAFQLGSLFAFEDGCDLGCLLRRLFSSWWTLFS